MSRVVSLVIGPTTFHIARFDAFRQLTILGDLQKEILPSAGSMLSAVLTEEGVARERDESAIVDAMRNLSSRIGGDSLEQWAAVLIDPDLVSFELPGREPQKLSKANRAMAFEDFSQVLELMFHILKHNFAGPLARWVGHFGPAQEKLAILSAGSTRPSNES